MKKYLLVTALFLLTPPVLAQSSEPIFEIAATRYLMGTVVNITARHNSVSQCQEALYFALKEMERVESLLSYQKENSEISQINRFAGVHPVKVSSETLAMMQRACRYGERLQGLFDVSIGPLSNLWGFNGEGEITLPPAARIKSLLNLVNYRNIEINLQDTTVYLKLKGMEIDLGGIAKGYAIDCGARVLKQRGVVRFLLDAGGDLYLCGPKDEQHDWMVGIKHPRKPDELIARFALTDCAVATSGDYERYADIAGKRYHHIIDPRTGLPSDQCQSVTVIATTAEEADVYATYLFVKGYAAAVADGIDPVPFLIIDSTGQVNISKSFRVKTAVELLN